MKENESVKKYLAEFIGTFVLVLFACGTACALGCDTRAGYLAVALSFGLVIVAMAYSIGNISGCHINPAVSLAMFINNKIDEYTGGANKFKSGLIWDEDPEIGDRIQITSIVTGLRFSDVLGEKEKSLDNYIIIDKNYSYNKEELSKGEGISLSGDASSHIGFSSKENERAFRYDPDNRPALLVKEGDNLSALESTPAIRRGAKKD